MLRGLPKSLREIYLDDPILTIGSDTQLHAILLTELKKRTGLGVSLEGQGLTGDEARFWKILPRVHVENKYAGLPRNHFGGLVNSFSGYRDDD